MNQPANSPDSNILDHAIFKSKQLLQRKKCACNIDELRNSVLQGFDEVLLQSWERIFGTLKEDMKLILKEKQCHQFKIPHVKKSQRLRKGEENEVNWKCLLRQFQFMTIKKMHSIQADIIQVNYDNFSSCLDQKLSSV